MTNENEEWLENAINRHNECSKESVYGQPLQRALARLDESSNNFVELFQKYKEITMGMAKCAKAARAKGYTNGSNESAILAAIEAAPEIEAEAEEEVIEDSNESSPSTGSALSNLFGDASGAKSNS